MIHFFSILFSLSLSFFLGGLTQSPITFQKVPYITKSGQDILQKIISSFPTEETKSEFNFGVNYLFKSKGCRGETLMYF